MTRYLLDSNVVSELMKRRPDGRAVAWLRRNSDCYLSVLTVGELERGVQALRARDVERAGRIGAWVRGLRAEYADRILDVDLVVVGCWAELPATRTLPVIDSLLAATAAAHGLTVATRNVRDFSDAGVSLVDPFSAEDPR